MKRLLTTTSLVLLLAICSSSACAAWLERVVTPSDGQANDAFGYTTLIRDDKAFVTSIGFSSNTYKGAVYIFQKQAGCTVSPCQWTQIQKIVASDGAAFDHFGWSIAFDGSKLAIGAPFADVGGHLNQGAAYVFKEVSGTWVQDQKLVATDGATDDNYGYSVAIDGSTVLVGSSHATANGHSGAGAAYLYKYVATSWLLTQN